MRNSPQRPLTASVALVVAFGFLTSHFVMGEDHKAEVNRVLVPGVFTSRKDLSNPDNPDNIKTYEHNFSKVLPLSFTDDNKPNESLIHDVEDLGFAAANLSGLLTEKIRGDLYSLKYVSVDEEYAHSWGAAAVLEAISAGEIQPPKNLIIIDPPNLTPSGGERWKELAERFPDMRIEIYMSQQDIFERTREALQSLKLLAGAATQNVLSDGTLVPNSGYPYLARDTLQYFESRNVTVRTYRSESTDLINAHSLKYFMAFAAEHHLHGLTMRPPTTVKSGDYYAGKAYSASSDTDFLVQVSNDTVKLTQIDEMIKINQESIRSGAAQLQIDAKSDMEAQWNYFKDLINYCCMGRAMPSDSGRSVYSVLFSPTVLDNFYARDRDSICSCGQELIEAVLKSQQPVNFAWLKRESTRIHDREARIARAEEKAERQRAAREAEARYERSEARLTSSGQEPGGSSSWSGADSSRHAPSNDGLGSRQAQGIAGGNSRIFDSR